MVRVSSTMLPLGTEVPGFALPNVVDGRTVTPEDFADDRALLVMFLCNHCPFVRHVLEEIDRLARDCRERGVGACAISANDVEAYPQDSPDEMKRLAESRGWEFPYLFDETQEVAKAFRAACTPDFYLFDDDRKLVYRGQLDDSRPGSAIPPTGRDVRSAVEAVLEGEPVPEEQTPSVGCNIKWKPGNQPEWFGA